MGRKLSKHEELLRAMPWWIRLGYRSKSAEFTLYFLAFSGLILWNGFTLDWTLVRFSLFVHFIAALFLFSIFVIPFWLSHRTLYNNSSKQPLRITGKILDYAILLMIVSGIYLTFVGNRGGDLSGQISYWTHLIVAIPLTVLVLYHAMKYSMLKLNKWVIGFAVAVILVFFGAHVFAAEESSSFVLSKDGKTLYSANFEAGSISKINKENSVLEKELHIGNDIRRIALDEEHHRLMASDYTDGKVHLIDLNDFEKITSIEVGKRPFGVAYDAKNQLFWITLFEDHRLLAINERGQILHSIATENTPRGLALLSDGRLLVTHSMIGKVSIFDTTTLPLTAPKIITLEVTQNADEFVSQGLPRLLDDIAISPNEKEAWLPHVLWNFDHPFQFQSTVFPAVSVLSLAKGKEHEFAERRKQLFEQINILENGTKTRIVSNPHDAEFSADGKKLYVTLAASEDLMVFDLSRRSVPKNQRNRHAKKQNQGGAKATQIFRHVPGDNPRGLVIDGEDIFVQNAMSLDIAKLSRGKGSFAKVKLASANFAKLVEQDPIAPELRAGMRLFNSGNRDDIPDHPMAGDYWMSCASCHVDGFNFTAGYLFEDFQHDKMENNIIGHADLKKLIADGNAGDLVRIIKDTQGGMGADEKNDPTSTNPDAPNKAAKQMMQHLAKFITSRGNLPQTSSWIRTEDKGQIPEHKWVNSAKCASCHSEIFDQWVDSNHHLMADSNPYYNVVEDIAASMEGEPFRKWCMGCHNPQAMLSGRRKTPDNGHMFEKGGHSLFIALEEKRPDIDEGTTCLMCHRMTSIENAMSTTSGGNASFTLDIAGRPTYMGEESLNGLLHWLGEKQINAKPEQHADSYSQDFYNSSRYCSTCHNEFAPGTGAVVVNTYKEWEDSPYNNPQKPEEKLNCLDCHMHKNIENIGTDIPGFSTDGGKKKANVRTHQFTGANHHLVGLRNKKLANMSIQLLKSAAKLELLPMQGNQLTVRVTNIGAGHHLPTGVADFRQLWLHVIAKDAQGNILYQSGQPSETGVVPKDARMFHKVFADKEGKPVGVAFWRNAKLIKDTRIPAKSHRDEIFILPKNIEAHTIEARLLFRIFPKWVNDAVQAHYPDLPTPEILELQKVSIKP